MIHHGDCVEVMAGMEPESVDAIVCDPPYGLEFMGREWDRLGAVVEHPADGEGPWGRTARVRYGRSAESMEAWHHRWATEAFRVAKPSAYLLAFGGTRTVHRLATAIEDAGWIIRDLLVWGYASGFPKSKASLKPAWEPIVMARKPGPLRELAIDRCRIGVEGGHEGAGPGPSLGILGDGLNGERAQPVPGMGRWPANIILTDPIFDGGWEGVVGGGEAGGGYGTVGVEIEPTSYTRAGRKDVGKVVGYGDSGTYSRFFLIPKAGRADREPVLGGLPLRENADWPQEMDPGAKRGARPRGNNHPTVKPTELMRHLVRLVTPSGGTVLDPFLGSGTTAIAAELEGFPWIGIEREAEYVAIAEARLNGTQRGLGLDVPAPTSPPPKTHPDLSKHQPKVQNYRGDFGFRGFSGEEDPAA